MIAKFNILYKDDRRYGDMGNTIHSILSRIEEKYKLTFISTCIAGLLTHLFMFTNLLPGNDQTMFYFNLGGTRSFGRWGLHVLQIKFPLTDSSILTGYGMPWVKGLISLCLIGVTACIVVAILDIKNHSICILTGTVLVTFPSVAATFSYMFTSSSYFLGLALAGAAAYWAKKSTKSLKWNIIGGGNRRSDYAVSIYLPILYMFHNRSFGGRFDSFGH